MADNNDLTPSFVMSGIATQRASGILCDVELKAEGKVIPAHRNVLAAASPFFYGMFTSDFKEKDDKVINLENVTFDALEMVIDSIYKFKIKLTDRLVPEVFAAAHLMQISGIIEQCKKHLMEKMSKATCFTFLAIAEKYELKDVITRANECILGNFVDISESPEFKKISKDALCNYLSSDTLNFKKNEALVFEAAQRWLEADRERLQYVGEVMKKVRFMLIAADKLGEIGNNKIMENNPECQRLIRDALVYHANILQQPVVVTDQNKPRGKGDVITIGGDSRTDIQGLGKDAEYTVYHGMACKTRMQQSFHELSLSAVQMNNFIFVFASDDDTRTPVTLRYNVSMNSWMDLKPVPRQATVGSRCTLLNDTVYLLGGKFVSSDRLLFGDVTSSAHSYSISSNAWVKITNLPQPVVNHAQCAMGTMIHISGGMAQSHIGYSKKHLVYDTTAALWLSKPPLNHPRSQHVMQAIGTTLYVLGGSRGGTYIEIIECYDSLSEQWTDINNTQLKISRCSSFCVDNIFIMITGGLSSASQANLPSDKVVKFDVRSHDITVLDYSLQTPDAGHFSAFMTLPGLL